MENFVIAFKNQRFVLIECNKSASHLFIRQTIAYFVVVMFREYNDLSSIKWWTDCIFVRNVSAGVLAGSRTLHVPANSRQKIFI